MIGQKYNEISSYEDLKGFCTSYEKNEIKNLFLSMNGSYLASNHGKDCPSSTSGIADIRRVLGAGLKVLSETCNSVSEQTKHSSSLILNHIKKYGFTLYNKIDGIIAYLCYTHKK